MKTEKLITELLEEWMATSQLLPATKSDYLNKITYWFSFLADSGINPREPTRQDIITYRDKLQQNHKSRYTIDKYITVVKRFYMWCSEQGYYDNIGNGIRAASLMKEYTKLALTAEQVGLLLSSIKTNNIIGQRDFTMIQLMLYCGLRTCEVSRIDITDISILEGVNIIYVQRKGKIDKKEYVKIEDDVYTSLKRYIQMRGNVSFGPLFIAHHIHKRNVTRLTQHSISTITKQRMIYAGINSPHYTAHSLRHTFGQMLVDSGVDIDIVRALLGHSNSKTTRIYVEMAIKRKLLHSSPTGQLAKELTILQNETHFKK